MKYTTKNRAGFLFKLTLGIVLFSITSCGSKKDKEEESKAAQHTAPSETIVGDWEAKWSITGQDVANYADYRKTMQGKMSFKDNGEVTITSYGFDSCLIKTDTSIDVMNWKLDDRMLRIIDKKDVNGIPYNILELEEDRVRLSLMGDIHLTLTK